MMSTKVKVRFIIITSWEFQSDKKGRIRKHNDSWSSYLNSDVSNSLGLLTLVARIITSGDGKILLIDCIENLRTRNDTD